MKKIQPEIWIERFKSVHGNKYDYSKSIFDSNLSKILIKCNHCLSEFNQTQFAHYRNKAGCPKCACIARSKHFSLGIEEFLKRAKEIHKDNFDYSYVEEYKNSSTKIRIICKNCGDDFYATPSTHIRGAGCSKCKRVKKLTHEEYVDKAIQIHGAYKFQYLSNYINMHEIIHIKCNVCNIDYQDKAMAHLQSGCLQCNGRKMTTQFFRKKLITKYGEDKFDFSDSDYKSLGTTNIKCKRCNQIIKRWCVNLLNRNVSCNNCDKASYRVSKICINWLNKLNIDNCFREKLIPSTKFHADALVGNTVYEFYGSYWHGDPRVFNHSDINTMCNKTFSDLYKETIEREQQIKSLGYEVKFIWEYDHRQNDLLFSTSHPV